MSVRTIVVGVDGSEVAARAVEWTAEVAGLLGARVIAVHSFQPLDHLGESPPPYDFAQIERAVTALLEGEWTAALAGVEHECKVLHGAPFECLLDAAQDAGADLVVVGTRGHSLLRGLALGSTATKLLHTSGLP
ncbi:MAG: universal stress protein, partial [Acidimicrobiia bacterium]|nr:universal stress protein [Acidimicrobiia bacterium]